MKKNTQVSMNHGSHRPNLRSGPKNLRIYRPTPGSSPRSPSPAADPRVAALIPEAPCAPQNFTPSRFVASFNVIYQVSTIGMARIKLPQKRPAITIPRGVWIARALLRKSSKSDHLPMTSFCVTSPMHGPRGQWTQLGYSVTRDFESSGMPNENEKPLLLKFEDGHMHHDNLRNLLF